MMASAEIKQWQSEKLLIPPRVGANPNPNSQIRALDAFLISFVQNQQQMKSLSGQLRKFEVPSS